MSQSMRKQFQTDLEKEKAGIWLEYDGFRVKIARSGGGNRKFKRVLEQVSKPYKRQLQTETLGDKKAEDVLYETYARSVVLDWETENDDGEMVRGIEGPEGGPLIIDFTVENVMATFRDLPELYADIREQSEKTSLFREFVLEEDSGN